MDCRKVFLGVDVGSVSTNLVLIDAYQLDVIEKVYVRTQGRPVQILQQALAYVAERGKWQVLGVGTTGSGRQLAGVIL